MTAEEADEAWLATMVAAMVRTSSGRRIRPASAAPGDPQEELAFLKKNGLARSRRNPVRSRARRLPVGLCDRSLDGGRSPGRPLAGSTRSEEHTSELQSRPHLVCRLLLE